jgi:hypothetical protein
LRFGETAEYESARERGPRSPPIWASIGRESGSMQCPEITDKLPELLVRQARPGRHPLLEVAVLQQPEQSPRSRFLYDGGVQVRGLVAAFSVVTMTLSAMTLVKVLPGHDGLGISGIGVFPVVSLRRSAGQF